MPKKIIREYFKYMFDLLKEKGVSTKRYDTTCPFVTRVWKRADQLGKQNHTVIIHGKHDHEETRATYSYSKKNAPSLIIKDMKEAIVLAEFILGKRSLSGFNAFFEGKYSEDFDPNTSLDKIGVINQTTMLATETQAISNYLKEVMVQKYGSENIKTHMADTRDTLCYATNENQDATYGLLISKADLALVVGGYNSSNTSHLVELCEEKLPTYYVANEQELLSSTKINHYDYKEKTTQITTNYLPKKQVVDIILTSGAPYQWYVISKSSLTLEEGKSSIWHFYLEGNPQASHFPFPAILVAPSDELIVSKILVIKNSVVVGGKMESKKLKKSFLKFSTGM